MKPTMKQDIAGISKLRNQKGTETFPLLPREVQSRSKFYFSTMNQSPLKSIIKWRAFVMLISLYSLKCPTKRVLTSVGMMTT